MPISQETFNKSLYDLLRTKGLDPVPVNTAGNKEPVPNTADVFKIDADGENVWITIDDAQQLKVYYDDEVMQQNMEDDTNFRNLLLHLKDWAKRRQLGFELVNRDHLASDMAQRDYMKKLDEGYYPLGKKSSYSDNVPKVKIVLQHTRQLEEGEQRFRNVERIFVENTNGERFAIPTNRPGLARVYARHIAEGGTPYDERGKHITSLVEEYSKMAGFVRATKNGQFNESAQRLVNEAVNHYQNLRETLTRMTTQRGYNKYFESYTPVLNEENEDNTSLNELFVQETLDPRIESVMPILKRLNKNINEMNEVKELEEWAESILEVEDETTKTLAKPAADMLDEAPGAETLAHNQSTEKSNLNAFDLDEEVKVKYEVVDKNGKRVGTWDGMIFKAYDRSKYPAGIMDKIPAGATVDKEFGPLDDKRIGMGKAGLEEDPMVAGKTPDELKRMRDVPTAQRIKSGETEPVDRTNYNLPPGQRPDTVGKPGWQIRKEKLATGSLEEGFSPSEEVADQIIDSLGGEVSLTSDDLYRAVEEYQTMMDSPHKLDVDEVVQIVMDRMNMTELEEDLDANQKRVGQLGPTEKVAKNSGARGKLVGASESVELDAIKRLSGIK